MLIGHYQTKVSAKGRVALPAKFKKKLGGKLIITANYEKSLMIVTPDSYQKVLGQIVNRPLTAKTARATDRFLLGSAFEIELDDQGRFIIPRYLRDYAGIGEEAVFIGIGNRVELWSESRWRLYEKYLDQNIDQLSENLPELT
ncbi:MAG: Protein MraZ [Candidatus Beckwithbacteria bacterium GW2011_GWB1_47_15]|uniref:Transcriptional regulator MraZ n=1 Tax=Candidatus Beckwithbacteria bacterium GW2011_GWB1_47_15 TaxID=1618371 RepID=A0A0G1RWI7_9BACT|nr:MAG: MraZ protein, MraZ protein [Candidatus Beckwithbacteria bacterium GW2011_GWC1_49_16]KKU35610.1 MAG: Protein MraZ [Candidatus Beckwithbacteria bacterium GW2011_GWA1_46_30]KKU61664.1 MAG: Protein MraZ [Candidatus Beckwithbacteria bacterium GW2011_GWB1_47_15]KKU72167.1 MAG: Protein MraZ [Candidatus Beckwithbacteria bacterium GW2011_GWA2_47_25]KKW04792.1 MAG: Protein MraZ [Candidatus Beckwithbacteria bacterium GW2011_GWC2_49_11]HAF63463.1 division/cell wall cluster transcriptional represso